MTKTYILLHKSDKKQVGGGKNEHINYVYRHPARGDEKNRNYNRSAWM